MEVFLELLTDRFAYLEVLQRSMDHDEALEVNCPIVRVVYMSLENSL